MRSRRSLVLLLSLGPVIAGCDSGTNATTTSSASSSDASSSSSTGAGGAGGSAPSFDPKAVCAELSRTPRAFEAGPYGQHRGDVAGDFTLDLADGTTWTFSEMFSGCESYVFVPDTLPVSDLDSKSVWESDKDVATLLKSSPKNTQYFFVSRRAADADAAVAITGMQARVDAQIAKLPAADAEHWRHRVHVVAKKAKDLGNWIGDVFATSGAIGFSIDLRQRLHGAGYLSDVKRYDPALDDAMKWPFKSNLAYAANEPKYLDAQAKLQDRLDADGATIVPIFDGEVLAEFADKEVTLPSAEQMKAFDTLEVEVTQRCPDPDKIELGNCGAWDYLAGLYLEDAAMTNQVEIARFITSYHRETHWVEDISQMLPLLAQGGLQKFRWSFAPSWNTQPTGTKLALRFSNQKKGMRPTSATFLWAGGDFNSAYNANRLPVSVPIPADAKKVEVWALVTGHGSGTSQCSEFCNHQHEFTVGATKTLVEFPMAGTDSECIGHLEDGMTPNQAGSWWFGRGGWCPGQQVTPRVIDVTANVNPGEIATISYRGLFHGSDPPDNAGNIDLTSYLVVYQ
ncbi:MAG: peptide-N-glycosidase F-related protein [Polyangiaceae bacterium]